MMDGTIQICLEDSRQAIQLVSITADGSLVSEGTEWWAMQLVGYAAGGLCSMGDYAAGGLCSWLGFAAGGAMQLAGYAAASYAAGRLCSWWATQL